MLLGAAFVLAMVACATVPRVFDALPSADSVTWIDRSIVPWWFPEPRIMDKKGWTPEYYEEYYYATHHPTLARILYRTALHAIGVTERPTQKWDYQTSVEQNVRDGNAPAPRVTRDLRAVNLGVFAVTALVAYFGLSWVLGSRFLGALAVLPMVFEPTLSADFRAVLPYIGTDALATLWLVAFWVAWLGAARGGAWTVVLLGVVGGLACGTKINAAFMLAGACVYFAASSGWERAWKPLAIGGVSLGVFLALNPVYLGDGPAWTARVLRDVVETMRRLEGTAELPWARYTREETLLAAFPHALFAVPVVAVLWRSRRDWWLGATAAWAGSVIALNLALIYMPLPRYSAPVRVAFWVMLAAAGFSEARRALAARGERSDGCDARPMEAKR